MNGIVLPGPGALNGQPAAPQIATMSCAACGQVMTVPAEMAQRIAEQHQAACIGPRLVRIEKMLDELAKAMAAEA